MNTENLLIKKHPSLDILVREDGAIYNKTLTKKEPTWNFGTLYGNGYYYVTIGRKKFLVHRLVAETFLPNPDNNPYVDHKNRDPKCNRVENLRWCTAHENNMNTSRNDRCLDRFGVSSFDDPKEYNLRQLRDWRKLHPDKVSEQNHRNHVRNYERRKIENADKIKAQRAIINATTKHVRFANGKRKRLPNAIAENTWHYQSLNVCTIRRTHDKRRVWL